MPDTQKAVRCDHDYRAGLIDPLSDDRAADAWRTIEFDSAFPPGRPVIVIPMTQTYNGRETPGLRLRNVNATGFEIRFDEVLGTGFSSDGNHLDEQVGWVAFSLLPEVL